MIFKVPLHSSCDTLETIGTITFFTLDELFSEALPMQWCISHNFKVKSVHTIRINMK